MNSPAAVFAAHCARRELAYQRDAEGAPLVPPRLRGASWHVSAGRGTVHATTTARPRGGAPNDLSLTTPSARAILPEAGGGHAHGSAACRSHARLRLRG